MQQDWLEQRDESFELVSRELKAREEFYAQSLKLQIEANDLMRELIAALQRR